MTGGLCVPARGQIVPGEQPRNRPQWRRPVVGSDGLEDHEVPGALVAEEVLGRRKWLRPSRGGYWRGHCPMRETVREEAADL